MAKTFSKEAFLQMARMAGVDMSDEGYLDRLYEDVEVVFQEVSILVEANLDGIEQAPVFATGFGLEAAQAGGGS
jgi:hypothetical protein